MSLCTAVKDITWIRKLAIELNIIGKEDPSKIFCDNQSTIRLALNEKVSQRTRHMSVRAAYPREQVENNEIDIKFVKSQNQDADILTKAQPVKDFLNNRDKVVKKLSIASKVFMSSVCLAHILVCINARILERVDPVLWRPTNKLVLLRFSNKARSNEAIKQEATRQTT